MEIQQQPTLTSYNLSAVFKGILYGVVIALVLILVWYIMAVNYRWSQERIANLILLHYTRMNADQIESNADAFKTIDVKIDSNMAIANIAKTRVNTYSGVTETQYIKLVSYKLTTDQDECPIGSLDCILV